MKQLTQIFLEGESPTLSKVLKQDFCYNYIKNKDGDKTEMVLAESDRLMQKIQNIPIMQIH